MSVNPLEADKISNNINFFHVDTNHQTIVNAADCASAASKLKWTDAGGVHNYCVVNGFGRIFTTAEYFRTSRVERMHDKIFVLVSRQKCGTQDYHFRELI